ncbi:MAG: DUF308 domain-containing protein [Ruminococcus sp.]|nr:DUF308 domain-containing protein [Ruminococcus sp.]
MYWFKKNLPILLMLLLEILVGVLLMVNPEGFTTVVYIAFGIFCLVVGAIYLIRYIRANRDGMGSTMMLIWAVVLLVLGLFGIISSTMVLKIFAFLAVMYAVLMIVSGVVKLVVYINARKNREPASPFVLIGAMVLMVLGGVVAVNPFETTEFLFRFIGVCVLASAVLDAVALILGLRAGKKAIDDGVADAEVLDR